MRVPEAPHAPPDPPVPQPQKSSESVVAHRVQLRLHDPRVRAAGAGLLLLAVAVGVVLGIGAHNSKPAAAAKRVTLPASTHASTAETSPAVTVQSTSPTGTTTSAATHLTAQTARQLAGLTSILKLAATGRQALASGDISAAIANRRAVVQALGAFHPDSELSPSVRALEAAEGYSLHADMTCGLSCASSIDAHATQLKQAFVGIFNPIAIRYRTATYAAGSI